MNTVFNIGNLNLLYEPTPLNWIM